MTRQYTNITFTDDVKAEQGRNGTRPQAERMEHVTFADERFTEREAEFVQTRDGFYMASVNSEGWPYVQFRGGPAGFVRVLDDHTFGYADFRGNQQYISMGNLRGDDRVSLFFMDYTRRMRLKVMARTEIVSAADRPDLIAQLEVPSYRARIERGVLFHVEAFDWNCPQHITPRFTAEEWKAVDAG